MTLYAAGEGEPIQLAQGKSGEDGTFKFDLGADQLKGASDKVLYLVARGGTPKAVAGKGANDSLVLLLVLGPSSPNAVTINEFTTVASAFTAARFIRASPSPGIRSGCESPQ